MALYRKYRPASFAEVVGQEHVTEPLSVALDSGQINHAYLFSGPRGCGKTSSARILARSLNCVEGPTSTPCGKCASCVSLAPGGPGNLDVTELDAATHNGVDDMRELRDRAFYAPAESRYRVFIIDEAHMISKEGFNALLKIVEEPPEHLIFIFATTEPEKMLATIRSRTHNYPFRLLTPPAMRNLLERVVEGEGKHIEDAVYPLVVRAGGGSPRDSLSVMDQLLAGSGSEGVTYQRALALLGVTDAALIDKAVDALAAQDQAGLFGVVDDVIDAGYDPRRFATDLLDRFRDLLILQAVPDAFDRGLVDAPAGAQDVLIAEAQQIGQATLTRCAALVNEGLAQMRGATSPRLLLEILCARMALPAAGMTVEALAQRVEALEQGRAVSGTPQGSEENNPVAAAAGAPATGSGRRYERPSRRNVHAADEEVKTEVEPLPGAQMEVEPSPGAASAPVDTTTEDPAIAEARRAREIMDRNHGKSTTAHSAASELSEATEEGPEAIEKSHDALERDSDEVKENCGAIEESPEVAEKWSDILGATKDLDMSAWIAARDARPAEEQPSRDELHIQHHTGALANFVNKHRAVYSQAAEKVLGRPVMVIAGVGNRKHAQTTLGEAQDNAGGQTTSEAQGNAGAQIGLDEAQGTAGAGAQGNADTTPTEGDDAQQGKEPAAPAADDTQYNSHHSPIPTEKDLDPREIRSASSSALERARAMAEAHRPSTPATHKHHTQEKQEKPLSGWKARAEKYRQRHQYNVDNGFNGVPLPPEPPADPWEAGPTDRLPRDDAPQPSDGMNASADPTPQTQPDRQVHPPHWQHPHGGTDKALGVRSAQNQPSGRPTRSEEDDILEQIAAGPGEMDHRKPLEIAGELVEKHLGGQRMR
ncbi:DNA polymerase III subunit gamma and tau [Corynebacterium sp. 4HC-13]|uniref:DNA polymerase III subunit gamma and tau n=1 Tax=Corynebacterium anserum TaxID=2684406 RepID=UPI00163ABC93|nr:DNA polymerase III subunit gamma and tau [Corynebacterium anserum]MBC2682431.1 DNA polymerase III subunit gamma and tau [Corynebacterium anserum]